MISKRNILVFFPFLLFASVFGQNKDSLNLKPTDISGKKFYFQMGFGYNFASGIGTRIKYVENTDGSETRQNYKGSWGKGFDIAFGLGYKITKSFSIETELGYFGGGPNTTKNQYIYSVAGLTAIDKQTYSFQGNTFRINPKLVLEVPIKIENAFYTKVGYMIGIGNAKATSEEAVSFSNGQSLNGNYDWKGTGGIVSGSTLALGFRFKSGDNGSVFVELTGANLGRKFKKAEMTYASEDGKDVLDSRSVYSKVTLYKDEATTNPSITPDPDKPKEYPSYWANYGSCGFRIGFIQHF